MSQLTAIGDALVTEIESIIPDLPTDGFGKKHAATVKRSWFAALMSPDEARQIDERVVYVLPLGRDFVVRASRADDQNAYRFGLVVADKIPGQYDGTARRDERDKFIDGFVEWVDELFDGLVANEFEPVTGAFLTDGEIRETCRMDVANGFGLAWAEIDLAFGIVEEN